MNIIATNADRDNKKEFYALTKSSATNVKDIPEGSYDVDKYCIYEDVDSNGEIKEVVVFIDTDGTKYASVSRTFKREFTDIIDIMGNEKFSILVKKGKARNGREYVTCELDTTK